MKNENYKSFSDAELLAKFKRDKNNFWLGVLLERYTLLLLGVSMKYLKNEEEAKDAVQQIFLKVISELQKYDVAYFKTWLYSVCKNHCLMQLRISKSYNEEIVDNLTASDNEEIDIALEKEKNLIAVEEAIKKLNDDQRLCINMFYLEEKSYKEIIAVTGMDYNTVKTNIQNGKRNLKLFIQRQQNEEN